MKGIKSKYTFWLSKVLVVLSVFFSNLSHAYSEDFRHTQPIVPGLHVRNDTRDNLFMLFNRYPLKMWQSVAVDRESQNKECYYLFGPDGHIVFDFWGPSLPRSCFDSDVYSYSLFSKASLYLNALEKEAQRSGGSLLASHLDPIFAQLPMVDQFLILHQSQFSQYSRPYWPSETSVLPASRFNKFFENYSYSSKPGYLISNNINTLAHFFHAINQDVTLSIQERVVLKQARLMLYQQILEDGKKHNFQIDAYANLLVEPSHSAQDFLKYLKAVIAFYEGNFHQATSDFNALLSANNPWIVEAVTYMQIRTALNQLAIYDDYWSIEPTSVDPIYVQRAFDAIARYLSKYPEGLYHSSAASLIRRVHWLSGDLDTLASLYEGLLQKNIQKNNVGGVGVESKLARLNLLQLFNEIDLIYLNSDKASITAERPLLSTILILKKLRNFPGQSTEKKVKDEFMELTFSVAKGLKDLGLISISEFLVQTTQWHLYQEGTVTSLEPMIIEQWFAPENFGAAVLHSDRLRLQHAYEKLVSHWETILTSGNITFTQHEYAQLELARAYILAHQIDEIFANDRLIDNALFRSLVIQQTLNNELLKKIVISGDNQAERETALYALLLNQLHQLKFEELTKTYALIEPLISNETEEKSMFAALLKEVLRIGEPSSEEGNYFSCPDMSEIFERLSQKGINNDATATLCFGDFLLELSFSAYENLILSDFLSDGINEIRTFNRHQLYEAVLNNPRASYEERAYALYRKINCYAPSAYNECGGETVSLSERKKWFSILKNKYSRSPWAKRLKYYW